MAGLTLDQAGALYGTTLYGGGGAPCHVSYGCGTVFKLTPPTAPETNWTSAILYRFRGSENDDGAYPNGGLLLDESGALYGTTSAGGDNDHGTVFKLAPPPTLGDAWTRTFLHRFKGGKDGSMPLAGLTRDGDGVFYGTASQNGRGLWGTVFKID
jgi:uncharacterized repeat protein (TIGR03803 family)